MASPSNIAVEKRSSLPWAELLWFLVLLAICFAPVLAAMAVEWYSDDDMGHGLFVIPTVLWMIWTRKDDIQAIPARSNGFGLFVVLGGAGLLVAGTLGSELFVSRFALVVTLCGMILYLGGSKLLRELAFPLFLLLFMIRIPAIIYNQITFPLQLIASNIAEQTLWTIGIPVLREGNILELPSQKLSVVEACSGIRSLLSLSFLSLVYAYFFDSKVWMRVALLVATIPIAVIANSFRVTMTGVLGEMNKEWASGLFHEAEGWLIFLISLAILAGVHRLINVAFTRLRASQ